MIPDCKYRENGMCTAICCENYADMPCQCEVCDKKETCIKGEVK